MQMLRVPRSRCVYIALTRLHAEDLLWGPLKDMLEALGMTTENGQVTYNESKLKCTFSNGSTLQLYGADNKREVEKLRGKPFHEVQIDEAASHDPALLANLIERIIEPRLGDYNGRLVLYGTPSQILRGLFYDATRPSSPLHRPFGSPVEDDEEWLGWSSHAWTLLDGVPYIEALASLWKRALRKKKKELWSDANPIWRREYLGLWAADDTLNIFTFCELLGAEDSRGPEGSPWNIWEPERVGPMRVAKLPKGRVDWLFGLGADMGAGDPFALHAFAVSPTDPTRTLYHVYEFESATDAKMYSKRIAELLFGGDDGKTKPWPNYTTPQGVLGALGAWPVGAMADMAALGDNILEEIKNVYGFTFEGAPRAPGDKMAAIELFNGDLVDGRIKIMKGSKLAEQLAALQWLRDEHGKLAFDKAQANHSADAAVYARPALVTLFQNDAPPEVPKPFFKPRVVKAPDAKRVPAPDFSADAFHGELDDGFEASWGND